MTFVDPLWVSVKICSQRYSERSSCSSLFQALQALPDLGDVAANSILCMVELRCRWGVFWVHKDLNGVSFLDTVGLRSIFRMKWHILRYDQRGKGVPPLVSVSSVRSRSERSRKELVDKDLRVWPNV